MPYKFVCFKPETNREDWVKAIQILIRAATKAYGSQGGVIVVFARNDGLVRYLEYSSISDYLWGDFNSQTHVEDPITFRSSKKAFAVAEKVQDEIDASSCDEKYKGDVCFAIWVHPDAGMPLEKYLKFTNHYPGCPRQ